LENFHHILRYPRSVSRNTLSRPMFQNRADGGPPNSNIGDSGQLWRCRRLLPFNVAATPSLALLGSSVIARINRDRVKQTPFEITSGHWRCNIPKASQSANAATVSKYMPTDISLVSRVRMIFHAWGTKLAIEAEAARYPNATP